MNSLVNVYCKTNIKIVKGRGVYLYDDCGKRYLDCMSGMGAVGFGHCNEYINSSLVKQINELWHCYNTVQNNEQSLLANRLVDLTFGDKVFFCSSGLESVEAMVKFVKYYWYKKGESRKNIISVEGGFHGRSLLGVSLSSSDRAKVGMGELFSNIKYVKRNDIESIKEVASNDTMAIILEPIQGEGGIRFLDVEYLRAIRELADKYNIILCFDEVQCGYARTGYLFHHEYLNVYPDIMTCAKSMGNGFPIGACIMTDKIANEMDIGMHGSTYSGNPLAMKVGNAVLDFILQDNFLEKVRNIGIYIENTLKNLIAQIEWMGELRGMGCMWGIDILGDFDKKKILQACADIGLLISVADGNKVLRIMPPMIIEKNEVDEMAEKLLKVTLHS